MIIFGDIAGNYLTFQKLLSIIEKKLGKSVPSEEEIVISLGDINDRGPKTKEMIQWFIDHAPHAKGILGNHEHMMIDFLRKNNWYQDYTLWDMNGGVATMRSYETGQVESGPGYIDLKGNVFYFEVSDTHLDWLESLPKYLEFDDVIITHAPINPAIPFSMALDPFTDSFNMGNTIRDNSVLWNRGAPRRRKDGKYQIHGHNSYQRPMWFKDKQGDYALGIDTSSYKWKERHPGMLSAVHWPSKEIFNTEIIDEQKY